MILAALAAAVAAHFAPPLDMVLHYARIDRHQAASGIAVVESEPLVRFHSAPDALTVTVTPGPAHVTAGPRLKPVLEMLNGTLAGLPITARLDRDGALAGSVDAPSAAAGWRAGQQQLLDHIAHDPSVTAQQRALGTDAIRHHLDVEGPDGALRAIVAGYLAPPLPLLAPGETIDQAATIATPSGPQKATSRITLIAADGHHLRYRIETVTNAEGARAAAAALHAKAASAPPAERARIEASAEALVGTVFAETTELDIEAATGLLLTCANRSEARGPGGKTGFIASHETRLLR